jgi:hypothetical protein
VSATEQQLFSLPTIVAQPAVGTFGVAEYRAYTVGRDGHFNGIEPLNCADDAEAIEKAQRLVDGHDVGAVSGL